MTGVNLAGLAALSECVGVDLNSLAFVSVEDVGSDRKNCLVIDCLYKAIALEMKDRMLEDCEFSVKLLETIKEYWGVEELFLKALGKACYLTSLEGEERANALIGASQKNQSTICKFSKRVGFDFGDSQIIPMSMTDGCTCLVINCLREDVAISLRERLAEDFRYRKLFAQAVHDFWGLSSICIKSKGEPYHYVSLEGAKRAEELVAPLYRMLDPKDLPLESEPLQAYFALLQDLLKQEGELKQTRVSLIRNKCVEVRCPNKYLAIKAIRLYGQLKGSGYGLRIIVGKEVVEEFPPCKQ